MLYNHVKTPVWIWDTKSESLCPECKAPLVARRGDRVVWHWAHLPSSHGRSCGVEAESGWHLQMKLAYAGFKGWESERPETYMGSRHIVDAAKPAARSAREFVHTINMDRLRAKHRALAELRYDTLWIYDGGEFASSRRKWIARGGLKNLLTPRAFDAHKITGGLVHMHGDGPRETGLWRHWMDNIWFPCEGGAAIAVMEAYEESHRKWEEIMRVAEGVAEIGCAK